MAIEHATPTPPSALSALPGFHANGIHRVFHAPPRILRFNIKSSGFSATLLRAGNGLWSAAPSEGNSDRCGSGVGGRLGLDRELRSSRPLAMRGVEAAGDDERGADPAPDIS